MPRADNTIPRVEERLNVRKETVVDGRVRVGTQTEFIEDHIDAKLDRQEIEVSRVPFNIEVSEAPQVRVEDDVTIVPVLEERLVKRLFLVEEVHIRRQTTSRTVSVPAVIRKQTVSVERTHEHNKEN